MATAVVYVERREVERRPVPEHVVKVGDQGMNRFTYTGIRLQDYTAQIHLALKASSLAQSGAPWGHPTPAEI